MSNAAVMSQSATWNHKVTCSYSLIQYGSHTVHTISYRHMFIAFKQSQFKIEKHPLRQMFQPNLSQFVNKFLSFVPSNNSSHHGPSAASIFRSLFIYILFIYFSTVSEKRTGHNDPPKWIQKNCHACSNLWFI